MRVLVTGGAGYIGSVMTSMLLKENHEALVLDNLSKGHREALRDAKLVVADIEQKDKIQEICMEFKPEACMHFAALSLVEESMKNPILYYQTNLSGGINLLDSLLASGCRIFVFSSTAAVYGIPDRVPIKEDDICKPINPYGHSKLMFEKVLEELDGLGKLKFISLRYFNAAGADLESDLGEDHEPETHLIPNVIRAALGIENKARIFGTDYPTPDGTCIRDYIHVVDLCRAHMLALERLAEGGNSAIYNLGNSRGFSVREVMDSVKRVSGKGFPVVEEKRRPGDPPVLIASSEKISNELGWEPEYTSLDEIVRTAWAWHSRHPGGY